MSRPHTIDPERAKAHCLTRAQFDDIASSDAPRTPSEPARYDESRSTAEGSERRPIEVVVVAM